jgi:type IV pilus assembly protein PilY1
MSKKSTLPVSALLRGMSLALAAGFAAASWAATPAQTPLLSRVSNPPNPNVLIDIDDSGSMQAHYMPEGEVHLDISTYTNPVLPSISSMCSLIDVFYGDQQDRGNYKGSCTALPAGISYAVPGNTSTTSGLFQRWMRSSDVNSIYYNPAVLYQPWQTVDTSGNLTRMPAGNYKLAFWNPASPPSKPDSTNTADLSQDASLTTLYCTGNTSGTCKSKSLTYDAGLYYVLKPNSDPQQIASFTEYDLNAGVATATFPASAARVCTVQPAPAGSGCCDTAGATGCSLAREQQNFANWFVYYRTRTHLVKGSLSESLPNVVNKIRLGWGTINTTGQTIDGKSTDVIKSGMRDLTMTQLGTVLSGIQGINPYGSTPLRKATQTVGTYFSRTDIGSPWADVPGSKATVSSCRRSYHLMTTDGYYNDSVSVGDIDGKTNAPDYANANPLNAAITQYKPSLPYKDGQSNMLADVAMNYYINDLQPAVDNRVTPNDSVGDIAFWQHLTMFTVGLGVRGTLNPATDLPALTNGTKSWGSDQIDDLWHAAVDTHGAFFSAKDSTSLAQALTTALGSAAASPHNESGASTSSTSLTDTTYEYLPIYHSVQWTGDISAYKLDPTTGTRAQTPLWTATSKMLDWTQRNIWTSDGSASVAFNTSMSATLKSTIASSNQDNLINYLRGDASNESASNLRARAREAGAKGTLGDFIDSPPTLVRNFVDLKYDNIGSAPGYRDFYNLKSARTFGVLFEGANDGMLHAFKVTNDPTASDNGQEIYAFIPNVMLGSLSTLAAQDYGLSTNFHRDYVDGPQSETDAFIATNRNSTPHWANLLLGSYGGGAPGFYALDTTDLTAFDGKTRMWESGTDNDIGYIYEPISAGPLAASNTGHLTAGSWKAFVGNGVDSQSGNAVLFVVDLATGNIDYRITLDNSGGNGLMGVTLLRDANNAVVAVYAGDLKGNLYRIEFTGTNAPIEAFKKNPLFTAISSSGVAQPISVPPLLVPSPQGGYMVLFGTGRLIDTADADSTAQQTFYGILDTTGNAASAETSISPFAVAMALNQQRGLLQAQTITGAGVGLYNVTANSVDWTTKFGWYMDLNPVSSTQRVLYPAQGVGGYVLINSVSPAPLASDPCMQNSGNTTFFLIGALDGKSNTSAVWDTNGNGVIDTNDSTAAGYSASGAGQSTIVMVPNPNNPNEFVNVTAGGNKIGAPPYNPPAATQIKNRVWQQIMTPPF